MIIAIEGPDRAGKTTLLDPIASHLCAQAITRLPTSLEASRVWHLVEPIYLHLLDQLTDPSKVYVTDRSMTVSAQVYATVFERPLLFDPSPWFKKEVIVYVETPLEVLEARHKEEDNDVFPARLYERVLAEYEKVLQNYATIRVDGTAPVNVSARHVVRMLQGFVRS